MLVPSFICFYIVSFFKDCLFLPVFFFISQQGQNMGFTTLQAPAMLL